MKIIFAPFLFLFLPTFTAWSNPPNPDLFPIENPGLGAGTRLGVITDQNNAPGQASNPPPIPTAYYQRISEEVEINKNQMHPDMAEIQKNLGEFQLAYPAIKMVFNGLLSQEGKKYNCDSLYLNFASEASMISLAIRLGNMYDSTNKQIEKIDDMDKLVDKVYEDTHDNDPNTNTQIDIKDFYGFMEDEYKILLDFAATDIAGDTLDLSSSIADLILAIYETTNFTSAKCIRIAP